MIGAIQASNRHPRATCGAVCDALSLRTMRGRLLGCLLAGAIAVAACSSSTPPEVTPPEGPGSDASTKRPDGAPDPGGDGGIDWDIV